MKRSGFCQSMVAATAGILILPGRAVAKGLRAGGTAERLYIGRYTTGPDEGISMAAMYPDQATLDRPELSASIINPSFLAFGRDRQILYAVGETDDFGGRSSGSVTGFRIDGRTGKLEPVGTVASLGAHPCHLAVDKTGRYIAVANYTGGNITILRISETGAPGDVTGHERLQGKGPDRERQESPHAHSVNFAPDNRFLYVCDLGSDKVWIYRFDPETGTIRPAPTPYYSAAPGAGPRHFAFHPDGRHAFVINELNSTLTALSCDPETGRLKELDTRSTLPEGFSGTNSCADVHVDPRGRFVYGSNRGHDSIAVFAWDSKNRIISLIQNQPVEGKTPRNFLIHGSGRFLLSANQNSDTITGFRLDPETGKLTFSGVSVRVGKPVCLVC